MQNDLISRSALIKTFEDEGLGDHSLIESVLAAGVYAKIENAPPVEAVEVVHGKWELGVPITCSVCKKPAAEHDSPISFWESPYCPWCGAKMDLQEVEEGG